MQQPLRFLDSDLGRPPSPGWYTATVATAGWRESAHGNRMVHVTLRLAEVGPPFERLADYFVLEGGSSQGMAYSRKRLVSLFHASALMPRPGDEILPDLLVGHVVEVKVAHELWKNAVRLQIVGYRRPQRPGEAIAAIDEIVGADGSGPGLD